MLISMIFLHYSRMHRYNNKHKKIYCVTNIRTVRMLELIVAPTTTQFLNTSEY